MRRFTTPLLTLALAASVVASCGGSTRTVAGELMPVQPTVERAPVDPDARTAEWVSGINKAGWEFHRTIEGNAISSPISIGAAFSLLRAGASEPTTETLDDIFGLPTTYDPEPDPESTPHQDLASHLAANAVLTELAEPSDGVTIELGNRLFSRVKPTQRFVDVAAAHYGAALVPMSTDSPEAAAAQVNDWTNVQTHGLVPKIVEPSNITPATALVIVNTVYLDADWLHPFAAGLTQPETFHLDTATTVETDFMQMPEPAQLRYIQRDDSTLVQLPYEDGDLSMWLLVPNEIDGLDAVEQAFDSTTFAEISAKATEGTVQISVPKWEYALPPADLLATWLCPVGLCEGAPLLNISPASQLQFAIHGAQITVDEEGTEAGAATAIGANESEPPEPDLVLDVDRPFSYLITHESTGSVVFVGRVVDPSK